MKKSILLICALFAMASCSDDKGDCVTCEINVFFNIEEELCQDGDNVVVTSTVIGISSDSTYLNTTVEALRLQFENDGYDCE